MRVIKVLNNSLVLALNDEGQEIILMGKGIGFQKTIGYKLSPKEIDKVFVLKDRELSRRIIRLAAETDSIYFEMAKSVIDYAVENYHMKLMDHIYLALTDHLAFAAKRIRNGVILQNFYTLDMKKFTPREFQVGEYAVQLMSRKLKVEVPLDEAGNIAFHFINAQYDNPSNSQNLIIAHAVSAVLDIVKYTLGLTYNEDSLSYSRYVTHIRLFVQRLVSHNQLPEDTSPLLYDQIAPVCQKEFACVDKIQIYVSEQFQTQITNQERLYDTREYRKESKDLSTVLTFMDRKTGQKRKLVMRDLVFINWRTGMPAKNSSYDTHLYKLCDDAGIERFCMHALRHTYATRAIESGMQPKVLQKLLGHASITTTMNRYVHVTDDSMKKAVAQFAKAQEAQKG